MNRRVYVLFIATLVTHLSLAVWHYQGLYQLPAACFLAINFMIMIAIRDWIIGFKLFSSEREIQQASQSRQQIFLFGSYRNEKDPYQKIHKVVSKIATWKTRTLKYLAFIGWSLFCSAIIFPRLNLPLTTGLILGLLASWVFLNSYQISHFLLAQALSFLIVVLSYLQTEGPSPWIYIPYILIFFSSLSLFRLLTRNRGSDAEGSAPFLFSSHFYNALNVTCMFMAFSFVTYHLIDYFESQAQPRVERLSDRLQKKIEDYASRKIEEYVSQQIELENKNKDNTRVTLSQSKKRQGYPRGRELHSNEPSITSEKMEELVRELADNQNQKRIQKIQERLEENKALFKDLNSQFRKSRSKFTDLERKQLQQGMEKSKRQIRNLQRKSLETIDFTALQSDLKKKNIDVNVDQIQKLLKSSWSKSGKVASAGQTQPGSNRKTNKNGESSFARRSSDREFNKAGEPHDHHPSFRGRGLEKQPKESQKGLLAETSNTLASGGDRKAGFKGEDGSALEGGPRTVAGSGSGRGKGAKSGFGLTSGKEQDLSSGAASSTTVGSDSDLAAGTNLASGSGIASRRGTQRTGEPSSIERKGHRKSGARLKGAMQDPKSIDTVFKDGKTGLSAEEKENKALLKKKRIKEWKVKIDQILKHLAGLLKIILVFCLGILIYRLSRHFRKYKVSETIIKQVGLSDEKKQNIHRKANVLRQSRLSPDQEVRLTYRFFLETMAMADFPKSQWCPATEFQWQVQQEFIGFEEAITPITEYFCRAEYGEKSMSEDELAHLRQARDLFVRRIVA